MVVFLGGSVESMDGNGSNLTTGTPIAAVAGDGVEDGCKATIGKPLNASKVVMDEV